MKNRESRRIVPASMLAIAVLVVVALLEVVVITRVFEVEASTIARVAPWAYEPFLKLVGEHPDSSYRPRSPQEGDRTNRVDQLSFDLLGEELALETNQVAVEAEAVVETNAVAVPEEVPVEPETPTNQPAATPEKEVVPVG